ncbi:transglycosylase domain-containing protein [Marmoricola sp. URHB0036]|uniref:transglycosylase domain-containing protein n=1 Tax=Marmoricola sp. URHB0036 TaxID=1298863 RepID=UPI00041B1073|nr:transglycosylase domain-containing protein [Marmoricola sp. URHB0036]
MSGNRSSASPGKRATSGSGKGSTTGAGGSGSGPRKATNGSGGGGSGKKKGGRYRRLKQVLTWLTIVGLAGLLVLIGVFYFAYQNTEIPDANKAFEAQSTYVYYSGGHSKVGRFAEQNRESIPLADIPQSMQNAAIAAEDRTFYTNSGIDPKGILRAAFSNAKGNATQGASTITQQYVKILYLSQERTLSRKVKEAFLSLKVQQEKSKSTILEGYLNTIYFGRGAYGVQAASNAYFGKPAKKLTVPESAMLAAVLNSPNYLSPDRGAAGRDALIERYDYVLRGMVSMGNLDATEADKYYGKLPATAKAKADNQYGGQRGFMLTMVKKELQRLGFDENQIESGGLRVETTFTKKAMKAAQDAVAAQRPEGLNKLHVATASVNVKTGALMGFYAGQDYLDSQLNWAALGGSPGSAFKPFALAAGLKAGFSLKDTFDGNSPYTFENGSKVVNEGEGGGTNYGSAISLLTATEESVNTAYSDLTESLPNGPEDILKTAVAMGIPRNTPGLEANNAIALGSATVSPITMANAYATIANGGVHHDMFMVKKVSRASDGKVLYRAPRKTDRALPDDIDRDVSYALQQVVKAGTGANAQALDRPAAGKTGTATNDDGDVSSSWFVGYTPQVSTAVMYVRGKGNGALNGYMPSYFGADYPTRTWTALMEGVLAGIDPEDFPPAAFVDGEAPADGHAPYTPPPKPTNKPKPKNKPTPKNTPAPPPSQPPPSQPGNGGGNGGGTGGGNGGGTGGGTGGGQCDPTDPTCTTP